MGGRPVTRPLVTITTVGAVELAVGLEQWGTDVAPKARSILRHYAELVRSDVIARAAGQLDVTDYTSTIHVAYGADSRWLRADIGTDDPAGYRHEFGFVGTDVLGRHYHDRPRPHFGPALDRYAAAFEAAIAELAVP